MAITCGNCKAKHDSVAEVKECYGFDIGQAAPAARATALRVLDEEGLSLEGLEDLDLVSP